MAAPPLLSQSTTTTSSAPSAVPTISRPVRRDWFTDIVSKKPECSWSLVTKRLELLVVGFINLKQHHVPQDVSTLIGIWFLDLSSLTIHTDIVRARDIMIQQNYNDILYRDAHLFEISMDRSIACLVNISYYKFTCIYGLNSKGYKKWMQSNDGKTGKFATFWIHRKDMFDINDHFISYFQLRLGSPLYINPREDFIYKITAEFSVDAEKSDNADIYETEWRLYHHLNAPPPPPPPQSQHRDNVKKYFACKIALGMNKDADIALWLKAMQKDKICQKQHDLVDYKRIYYLVQYLHGKNEYKFTMQDFMDDIVYGSFSSTKYKSIKTTLHKAISQIASKPVILPLTNWKKIPLTKDIEISVIKVGDGVIPGKDSLVDIGYTLYLAKKEKQILKRSEYIQLGNRKCIKGLEQALTQITVGSVVELFVPSKLAYGKKRGNKLIPSNSDLKFDLTLYRIVNREEMEEEEKRKEIEIEIIKDGDGSIPGKYDKVEIEYIGYLAKNNKQFIKHREMIQLGKKKNIKGLEQALTQIKVGSVIKLWIPWRLAYSRRGAGVMIPPYSDLEFDLTLHQIV